MDILCREKYAGQVCQSLRNNVLELPWMDSWKNGGSSRKRRHKIVGNVNICISDYLLSKGHKMGIFGPIFIAGLAIARALKLAVKLRMQGSSDQ